MPEREDYAPDETADRGQVFDAAAYRALELDDLFRCLDTTKLVLGQCALQRSLTSPSTDPDGVRARQEALLEIEGSPRIAQAAAVPGRFQRQGASRRSST